MLPLSLQARLASRVGPGSPLLGPLSPLSGSPERALDTGALYAGQTVARIADIRPAAAIVAGLAP